MKTMIKDTKDLDYRDIQLHMIILVFKVVDLPINHCKRHFFIILLYIVIFLEVSFMTSFFDNFTLLNRMLKNKNNKKDKTFQIYV